jgi:hypothetical protein
MNHESEVKHRSTIGGISKKRNLFQFIFTIVTVLRALGPVVDYPSLLEGPAGYEAGPHVSVPFPASLPP